MRFLALAILLLPAVPDAGVVKGSVTLKGDAPPRKIQRVLRGLDRVEQAYPQGIPYDPLPVDKDNRVASVLVYIKKGLEGKTFPVPKEPKQLRFEKYQIQPRMTGIMTGQEFVMTNLDPDLHAMQSNPHAEGNKMFNIGFPGKDTHDKRAFPKPEICILLTSNCTHDWERAWLAVLPHPFYAVTDEHGTFEIRGLPPGKYTLEAWQENCAPMTLAIEIEANGTTAADFTLEAKPK